MGGGAPTYDFVNFRQKLHENEEILAAGGGGRPLRPPLDPPLIFMYVVQNLQNLWIFQHLSHGCCNVKKFYTAHTIRRQYICTLMYLTLPLLENSDNDMALNLIAINKLRLSDV